jgi:hypothetical protein
MHCIVDLRSDWRRRTALAVAPGRFVADDLAPGPWTVQIRAPEYAGIEDVDVAIRDAAEPVVLDIELDRGLVLRGRVRVQGVESFVTPQASVTGPGAPVMEVASDGSYSIRSLERGASYQVLVSHVPKVETWEHFIMLTKLQVPETAPDVVEKDLELVPAGAIILRIKAPRMLDPATHAPASDEQWRLARSSRVTVRKAGGGWSDEWQPVKAFHLLTMPFGTYVVRFQVPGVEPDERTVTVSADVTLLQFTIP